MRFPYDQPCAWSSILLLRIAMLLDGPAGTVSIREKLKAFAAEQELQI